MKNDHYVYVYIDPRNYEEFYYGKGKASRKEAHLTASSDNQKTKRIAQIRKEGLEPIIRVIAHNLNDREASLIETTLLWKLGKYTDNLVAGPLSKKHFRPLDTIYKELSDFDFRNGLYYYNVGEGKHRNWDDYVKFGFISAGGNIRWRDSICRFQPGDVFIAYLKGHGFVGVGRIKEKARMIRDVRINNKRLLDLNLRCKKMSDRSENSKRSEYVAVVQWLKTVSRKDAKWRSHSKLYTTQHVRASLDGQQETVNYIEQTFDINIRKLLRRV
jgi:uncharacterized protein